MENKTRRDIITMGGMVVAGGILLGVDAAQAAEGAERMDAITAIKTRRSVRAYTKEPVSERDIQELLAAAMAAPSAGNEQPWEFVVIRDPETLARVGEINRYAAMAKNAPVAILTCANESREKYAGYGIVDVAACTQNMLLAAHALGLGAVWTGIYPQKDRIEGFRRLLGIPETVIPVALVVIGHPQSRPQPVNRFDASRVHQEKW